MARILPLLACLLLHAPAAALAQDKDPPRNPNTIRLEGVEALRYMAKHGQPVDAANIAYVLLWPDIRKPEELALLAQAMVKMGRRADAATWYRIFLRVAEEKPAEAAPFKTAADNFLKFGDRDHDALVKQYRAKAGGKFPGPESVSDLWMTHVTGDLHNLHDLMAWKLVGGPKGADPKSIHSLQGTIHRSGMKLMDEVEGRKGVLMALPRPRAAAPSREKPVEPAADDAKEKPKDAPAAAPRGGAITFTYPGKGKTLRIAVRSLQAPFTLEVSIAGKPLFTQNVTGAQWHDLKADLPASLKAGDEILIELLPPQGQRSHQGAWVDYLDVFED
jgi:hypothetical protein